MKLNGVILPVVTPFINNELDEDSYISLIKHYSKKGLSAIIPAGTTGETSVLSDYEFERLIELTVSYTSLPVYAGCGGNNTLRVLERIKTLEKYRIDGFLSVCPYYNRPSQEGLYEHFRMISETTDLDIIIYNIPYRTGVNMSNDTLLKLAELKNIIGVKDSSGCISQSLELIYNKPNDFSVMTGEDILFYTNVVNGGDGGILASSHIYTEKFVEIFNLLKNNDHLSAKILWKDLSCFIPMLFMEPNPAPLKYLLDRCGLINSDEVRLPLTGITKNLKSKLEGFSFNDV